MMQVAHVVTSVF